jgi:hypothetical protein
MQIYLQFSERKYLRRSQSTIKKQANATHQTVFIISAVNKLRKKFFTRTNDR